MIALQSTLNILTVRQVSEEELEHEKKVLTEQALNEGKPITSMKNDCWTFKQILS